MNLNVLDGTSLKELLEAGDVSNRDVMNACLNRIDEVEQSVGAFLTLRSRGELLCLADSYDTRRSRGEEIGPLSGLPVAVKDNICTKGLRTTCGSRMLETFVPPYDATVIQRINEADGIVVGKTNMDEFAMGSSTENSAFKITRNPHNTAYVSGGTSGGSAASVAAGETVFALGSDTGGSIRQPASYCGVVGLKPSYGRVSRYGLIAYVSSFDQIGTLTRSVDDAALLFSVISGRDSRDATSLDDTFSLIDGRPSHGLRIGVPEEYLTAGLDTEVRGGIDRTIRSLQRLGHQTLTVSLKHTKYAVPTYYIIACAEASSNLARFSGVIEGYRGRSINDRTYQEMVATTRGQGFGPEVRRRIILGTYCLSSGYYDQYYNQATKVRSLIRQDFESVFLDCDLLLTPVAPTPAFRVGDKSEDPLTMYLVDIFSVTANLAGIPAISLPVGFSSSGLPLSIQLIGPRLAENRILACASQLEAEFRSNDWWTLKTPHFNGC